MNRYEPYLRSIQLERQRFPFHDQYPFNVGAIKHLDTFQFHPNVTYIVGENGMGKSTLIESIAVAWGFNPEGGTRNFSFSTRT